MSAKITCDVEENIMFGKALMWHVGKKIELKRDQKRREREREERRRGGGGVIKVGGAIT